MKNIVASLLLTLTCIYAFGNFNKTVALENANRVIKMLIEGDGHHHHGKATIPENTTISEVKLVEKKAIFYLEIPLEALESEYDELLFEELGLRLFNVLPQDWGLNEFEILVKDRSGKYVHLSDFGVIIKDEPYQYPDNDIGDGGPKIRLSDKIQTKKHNPTLGQGQPQGNLSGKTVWLSPGHGWLYYTSVNGYTTQRGETNDMVEDFGTIEGINYYLLKYLWNAGANIWSVRERDVNTNEVVVDNTRYHYNWRSNSHCKVDTQYSKIRLVLGFNSLPGF